MCFFECDVRLGHRAGKIRPRIFAVGADPICSERSDCLLACRFCSAGSLETHRAVFAASWSRIALRVTVDDKSK